MKVYAMYTTEYKKKINSNENLKRSDMLTLKL